MQQKLFMLKTEIDSVRFHSLLRTYKAVYMFPLLVKTRHVTITFFFQLLIRILCLRRTLELETRLIYMRIEYFVLLKQREKVHVIFLTLYSKHGKLDAHVNRVIDKKSYVRIGITLSEQ